MEIIITRIQRPPAGSSDRRRWEEIEELIIKDWGISRDQIQPEEDWDRTVRHLPVRTKVMNSVSPQPWIISEELVTTIQQFLRKEWFRARFHFRGLKLEEITLLPLS